MAPPEPPHRSPIVTLAAIVLACVGALAVGHRLGDRTGLPPGERVLDGTVYATSGDDVRYGLDAAASDGLSGAALGEGEGLEGDPATPDAGDGAPPDAGAGAGGGEADGHGGDPGGGRAGTAGGAAGMGARGGGRGYAAGSGGGGAGEAAPDAAATGLAQAPTASAAPAPPAAPEEALGSLVGRIVDPEGVGVDGASVRVLSGSRTYHDVKSSGDGRYRADGVRGGRYRLVARASGFQDVAFPGTVDLAPGEVRILDDVAIAPSGRISGRVVDKEGAPVAGARIAAERGGAFGGYTARSGADGAFSLDRVGVGKVRIRASHDDYLTTGWLTVTVPRLEDGTAGEALDALLTMKRGASIEGSVTGVDGAPADLGVGLHDARGRRLERTQSRGGRYRFEGLGAGRYQVVTDHAKGALARVEATLAANETRSLDLVLEGGGVLVIACVDAEGAPVKDVRVTASAPSFAQAPSAVTGADGKARITGLLDEPYAVSARPPERYSVPDPLSIAVVSAAGPQEAAFQLSSGATIAGRATARDGGPAGGARVVVHDRSGARLASVDADPGGRFRIPRLPPGDVDVYVALGSDLGRAPLRLAAEVEVPLTVPLGPAAKIRGIVLRGSGAVAGNVTVEAVSLEGVVRRSAKSNAKTGAFELGTLYEGRYTVTASLGGARAGPLDVRVSPGEVLADVTLTIP